MTIYIPDNHQGQFISKELFLLAIPFRSETKWEIDSMFESKWNMKADEYKLVSTIEESDCIILPRSLNYYIQHGFFSFLQELNQQCMVYNKKVFAYIAGDFGEKYPPLSQFIYFRMGGFRSQLDAQNRSFPSALSDYLIRLYQTEDIAPIEWQEKPIVGFCGQANLSYIKAFKERLKFVRENLKRFLKNPIRSDYEPLFASGYERAKLLKVIEANAIINTRFIYRSQYRAGAYTPEAVAQTTKEYYDNLRESQYVVCIRGGGNFSVRFYQTLMMGRIPIFVNTDCLLPFENSIDWKKHVVWVEWHERHLIVEKIMNFHKQFTPKQFIELQQANRFIWKNKLSVSEIFKLLEKEL